MSRLNDIFTALTVAGSLVVLLKGFGQIKISDWLIGIGAGLLVGVTMYYATLFTPYDFLGIVQGNVAQALVRGVCTFIAMLGGLAIMRQDGTVQVSLAQGNISENVRQYPYWIGNWFAVGDPECLCIAVHPRSIHHLAKPCSRLVRRPSASACRGDRLSICLFRSRVDGTATFHATIGRLAGRFIGSVRPQLHAF
jgi:F0F1-type ATP synthase membrane subunit c/vacuolar-type H+-ATPase subunit K